MSINKSSIVPIYHQLKTLLRKNIETGDYPLGMCLPSEREFCEKYSISRMTVRQAITELVSEGLLRRERGKGTFVVRPKIEQGLSSLTSFTQDMHQRQMKPGAKLLALRTITVSGRIAEKLKLRENEKVHEIIRLRLADDEPMAIETAYLPLRYVAKLLPDKLEKGSLYDTLRAQGITISFAEQTLEAAFAKSYDAEQLNIKPRAPVLLIERTTYMQTGEPIEFVISIYRGDRYKFTMKLSSMALCKKQ